MWRWFHYVTGWPAHLPLFHGTLIADERPYLLLWRLSTVIIGVTTFSMVGLHLIRIAISMLKRGVAFRVRQLLRQ